MLLWSTSHIPNQRWTGSWTAGRRSCKYSGKCKGKCPPRRRYSCCQRITKKIKKRKAARSSQGNPPQKKRKILDVKTTKYGRKKHPFTNRVSQHAETMRTMYRVHVPLPANRSDAVAAVTVMPVAPARADMSKPKMHGGDKTSGDVPKVPAVPASSQNAKQPETTPAQMSHLQSKVFIDLTGNHISPQMKPWWIPAF